MKFATDPTPNHFAGEDVIGEELYTPNKQPTINKIPPQILSRLNQQISETNLHTPVETEEINISQPLQVTCQPTNSEVQNTITKNIKINLEINLKINVV